MVNYNGVMPFHVECEKCAKKEPITINLSDGEMIRVENIETAPMTLCSCGHAQKAPLGVYKGGKNGVEKIDRFSFTTDFHFQNGKAYFTGFVMETKISDEIGAKYRVLLKKPGTDDFWTMTGMEDPMTQDDIHNVIENTHHGSVASDEFVFEVFDRDDGKLFNTKFIASERIPAGGYCNDKLVITTFSWVFDLPYDLVKKEIIDKEAQ